MALIALVANVVTTGTTFHGSCRMKIRTVQIEQSPAKHMVGSFPVTIVAGLWICIKLSFMGVAGVADSGSGFKFYMTVLTMNPFSLNRDFTSVR